MEPKQYIEQNRAAIFDWTVMMTSILLSFLFPTIRDFIVSPAFHSWMLAALAAYTVGVALKHLPLSYRLSFSGITPRPIPYLLFLVIGHWIIFFIVSMLAEPAFRSIVGMPAITLAEPGGQDSPASGKQLIICFGIAAIVTWLAYRRKTNRKNRGKHTGQSLFVQELVADILLIASVTVLSFLFWEQGVMTMLGRAKTQTFADIWFLFVFLCILFVFFYLPLRYLYFVEDRQPGRNRRRLFLIFTFMILRAILSMLSI